MLAYIKNVLKANAVGIVWIFYAASRQSDAVETTDATLSASNVAILTRIARADHLLVEYRPLILVPSTPDHWEGLISPQDPAQWFQSYYEAELPYLKRARQLGVQEFVTATEMHKLNISPLWRKFFVRVAKVYHGVISYASWDVDYFSPDRYIPPVKYVGVNLYHRLHLPPDATAADVADDFDSLFSKEPVALLRRTAIDETGIQARAGAYLDPSNLEAPGQLDEQVQANWYTAVCSVVHRFHLRGVFFWKVDLTDYPAHPATSLSTFEGKKGAAAITACARTLLN